MSSTNGRKPTLKFIADQLGVSKATVSNAFNRPDQLSGELRERIMNQCQALGYTGPSIAARSLRTGQTRVVGVLLADCLSFNFTDPVASHFLEGVANRLDQQHVNMLLLPSCEENYLNTQVETIPDSFIVYGQPGDRTILERLARQGKPMVTVDFDTGLGHSVSVNVDNRKAACESARHALRGEDRRVCVLGLRLSPAEQPGVADLSRLYSSEASISRRRLDGYLDALAELDIPLPDNAIWHLPWQDAEQIRVLVRGLLASPERPQVLLCMSDKIALAALSAAQDLGIGVPDELRIVGFDDIPQAAERSLTTIHQPLSDKGRLAAEIVLGLKPFEPVELTASLVVRSTA